MFNNRFLKALLPLVFIFSCLGTYAQATRILLIPFDKFQFESPTPIEEIAGFNDLKKSSEVYEAYNQALSSYLNQFSDSLMFFHPADNDLEYIRRITPREYKKDPVTHFGIDIEPLIKDGKLESILENMQADYILFFSRYKIVGKLLSSRANVSTTGKFIAWSNHYLDYELYDFRGNLIAGSDRYPLSPHNPTAKTYLTKGTLVNGLERPSEKLANDIAYKIAKAKRKGEVVFKNKTK